MYDINNVSCYKLPGNLNVHSNICNIITNYGFRAHIMSKRHIDSSTSGVPEGHLHFFFQEDPCICIGVYTEVGLGLSRSVLVNLHPSLAGSQMI